MQAKHESDKVLSTLCHLHLVIWLEVILGVEVISQCDILRFRGIFLALCARDCEIESMNGLKICTNFLFNYFYLILINILLFN